MNQTVSAGADTSVLDKIVGSFQVGAATDVMRLLPDGCIDLIVTSPPYWTAVEYDGDSTGWATYQAYLDDMQRVWIECARLLRANGKLCINAPIMPIPKVVIEQHTRHLKNIAFDLEARILAESTLERYSLFVWQKQTSKMMFGSYPQPGNIIENNTIEFINVYVKPGKPPKFSDEVKEANKLSRTEWLDLAQQVWFMYPEDVKREEGHPAPFPEKLPARLMRLYTNGATESFPGEIVLDPFVGTGTTCVVAERMGRRWIGIDISERYVEYARQRMKRLNPSDPVLLVGRAKYPGKDELAALAVQEAGTSGAQAAAKHRRKTYGRGMPENSEEGQMLLV